MTKEVNVESKGDRKDGSWNFGDLKLCDPIPPHSPYGVSFHVPEWDNSVQFMEENMEVVSKLDYGYPRVFIHEFVKQLNSKILASIEMGENFSCFSFASSRISQDCLEYFNRHAETPEQKDGLELVKAGKYRVIPTPGSSYEEIIVNYVAFPKSLGTLAQYFWQNSGEIISSRFAAHCLRISSDKDQNEKAIKSQSRFYKENRTIDSTKQGLEYEVYLEECLGAAEALNNEQFYKDAIKSRVAEGVSAGEVDKKATKSDVFLFPTGMSSIYNTLRLALSTFEPAKSVCFGFPYKDTKKVLSQFGPGCIFYGVGESEDLAKLEKLLESERILMLICEFPTNPLLKSPDLMALRKLADTHGFLLVVDDTLGNYINLQGLLIADVIVTSLTKIISGFSDLMAGCITLSPKSKHYEVLKSKIMEVCEDNFWCEDALVLEKNSRSVKERAHKVNQTSESLADFLKDQPSVKQIHYPKYTTTELYNKFKKPDGGYGGLLSIEFHENHQAIAFYDFIKLPKGPSLGTNFTLALPYIILAHYKELDDVKKLGVHSHLVRVAVGLEDFDSLKAVFQEAFDHIKSEP